MSTQPNGSSCLDSTPGNGYWKGGLSERKRKTRDTQLLFSKWFFKILHCSIVEKEGLLNLIKADFWLRSKQKSEPTGSLDGNISCMFTKSEQKRLISETDWTAWERHWLLIEKSLFLGSSLAGGRTDRWLHIHLQTEIIVSPRISELQTTVQYKNSRKKYPPTIVPTHFYRCFNWNVSLATKHPQCLWLPAGYYQRHTWLNLSINPGLTTTHQHSQSWNSVKQSWWNSIFAISYGRYTQHTSNVPFSDFLTSIKFSETK